MSMWISVNYFILIYLYYIVFTVYLKITLVGKAIVSVYDYFIELDTCIFQSYIELETVYLEFDSVCNII